MHSLAFYLWFFTAYFLWRYWQMWKVEPTLNLWSEKFGHAAHHCAQTLAEPLYQNQLGPDERLGAGFDTLIERVTANKIRVSRPVVVRVHTTAPGRTDRWLQHFELPSRYRYWLIVTTTMHVMWPRSEGADHMLPWLLAIVSLVWGLWGLVHVGGPLDSQFPSS